MAGHSKWANIQHRKGAQDAKRAKIFAKLSKEIMVAANLGGSEIASNPSLRLAVSKAKAQSMPKKNIETAINKGAGNVNADAFKEIVYGGNVAGVSFLIICLTDNFNRVAAQIQHLFSKVGGSVSGASAVSYIFDRKGILEVEKSIGSEETIMLQAIESGAEDFEVSEDSYLIYTSSSNFAVVKENLEKIGIIDFRTAELKYLPNQEVKLPQEKAEKIIDFIDKLEDDEDVQEVYHNLDADSFQ